MSKTGHPMISKHTLKNNRVYLNGLDISNGKVCYMCKTSIGLIDHMKCSKIACNIFFILATCIFCSEDIVDDRDLYFPYDVDYEYDKYFRWDDT